MKWPIGGAAGRALGQAALIAALGGAVWLVYYPSLDHGPRADQWCFLLDTVDQHSFSALLAHTYSYNRTRMVAPGDYHLFRPVLFALLSGEKAVFGNNFALWQTAGILLHCLVMYLLLRLLFRIDKLRGEGTATADEGRWLSQRMMARAVFFGVVLYFGLNCAVVEMVIWAHINGYVLFVVFVLGSMRLLLEGIAAGQSPGKKWAWLLGSAWVLTLLSAFTYEIGQFYAAIAGALAAAALYRKGEARRSVVVFAMFVGILVIYRLANFLDQRLHADRAPDIQIAAILERMASFPTLAHAGRYVLYNALQPFFPSWVDWSLGSRLVIPEAAAARWNDWGDSRLPIVSYGLIFGMAALTLLGLRRLWAAQHKRIGLTIALLAFSLFALHMAITVFGRMNVRPGPDVLSNNSYYPYIPWLFLLLAASALWAFPPLGPSAARTRLSNSLSVLLFAGFVVLSAFSAVKVHAINVKGRDDFAGFTRRVAWVERFIQQHRGEADFSLAFDLDSCQAIGTQYGVPITTILFQRYLKPSCPKYVLSFPDGEPWASQGPSRALCPQLVYVGSSYNYFHVAGWYYGVLHWDGCYDPARRDHAYLIKAPTLEEARRQQWNKLNEQEADIRAGRFIPPKLSVTLLVEGYKGFNLIGANGKVYAIPQGEGGFDPGKVLNHGYSRSYLGRTAAEVKSRIDLD